MFTIDNTIEIAARVRTAITTEAGYIVMTCVAHDNNADWLATTLALGESANGYMMTGTGEPIRKAA